jgi:hypothetical protein
MKQAVLALLFLFALSTLAIRDRMRPFSPALPRSTFITIQERQS